MMSQYIVRNNLGGVHKLCLQEDRLVQKYLVFVTVCYVENVSPVGIGVQRRPKIFGAILLGKRHLR